MGETRPGRASLVHEDDPDRAADQRLLPEAEGATPRSSWWRMNSHSGRSRTRRRRCPATCCPGAGRSARGDGGRSGRARPRRHVVDRPTPRRIAGTNNPERSCPSGVGPGLRDRTLPPRESWQHPWQHPDRPMRPYRPRAGTLRTIWLATDGYDTRVTRLRAWSGITGWRFESSSAHRKALHSRAFRVVSDHSGASASGRGNTRKAALCEAQRLLLFGGEQGPNDRCRVLVWSRRGTLHLRSCSSSRAGASSGRTEKLASASERRPQTSLPTALAACTLRMRRQFGPNLTTTPVKTLGTSSGLAVADPCPARLAAL